MRNSLLIVASLHFSLFLNAQTGKTTVLGGQILPYIIDDCGDTLILAQLEDVSVSSPRRFANRDEYNKYRRYRQYAAKVYPYAVEAIKVFWLVQQETEDLKKRKKRKEIKDTHKELKEKFEDPLKKLTKTQGMILMKMIEKELDTPVFYLIKDLKGGVTASYWGTMGRLYGHHLKDGYTPGQDPILDMVLNDFNISFEQYSK